MVMRNTRDRTDAPRARKDVRAGHTEVLPLAAATRAPARPDTPVVRPSPIVQAVVLTRDLIAERAQAIWLKRGCPRNRDEENWREAEAQLKMELGLV
jgi:hypothetical protein